LKEALEPGRAEAQHDFSERDDGSVHARAAATLATTR
jgi:hypothetical protein